MSSTLSEYDSVLKSTLHLDNLIFLCVLRGKFMDLHYYWLDLMILIKPGRPFSDSWKMMNSFAERSHLSFIESSTIENPVYLRAIHDRRMITRTVSASYAAVSLMLPSFLAFGNDRKEARARLRESTESIRQFCRFLLQIVQNWIKGRLPRNDAFPATEALDATHASSPQLASHYTANTRQLNQGSCTPLDMLV
jgi:hypothetical protein